VIDWSSCQRPAALYRASGNRYFPFAHGPPNLSTPGRKSVVPVWPTYSFKLGFCLLLPSRWLSWCMWHACVPLRCRDVALPLLVQSKRQSPKSGGVLLLSFAHGTLVLPAKSPLSQFPHLGLLTLFLSAFFNRSSPRRYYANSPSVVTAIGICGELFNSSQRTIYHLRS